MKFAARIFSFVLLLSLMGQYSPGIPSQLTSQPELPHAMPPYPGLYDEIDRGEVTLPRFMTDPIWAQTVGLEAASVNGSTAPLTGSIRVLAVLVDFNDKVRSVSAGAFDTLLFAPPTIGLGSVRDYFSEISYGQVDIVTVNMPSAIGWKRAPSNYSYYANGSYCTDGVYPRNCQKLAEDVINVVDSMVNFKNYDNDGDGNAEPIVIIHSGPGAELTGFATDIWSHSWSTHSVLTKDGVNVSRYTIQPEFWEYVDPSETDMTIGVIAHEMGHGFWNLPDLYDRNNRSNGIGEFDLMASGSWNGTLGSSPAWPSAWTRIQMGFAAPTLVKHSEIGSSIPQPYNAPAANTILKLTSPSLHDSNEYYLLENRGTASGHYDSSIPGNGLFIWHIDENMKTSSKQNDYPCPSNPQSSCSDSYHYLVALMQADGAHGLEGLYNRGDYGDPYPGLSGNRSFTNQTNPDSGSWYAAGDSGIRVTNISNAGAAMTADITVPPINTAPVAVDDSYGVAEDAPLTVAAPGVIDNDTDEDANPLTAAKVSNPLHGSLTLNSDGSFTYTPDVNWNGVDHFTYKVNDGTLYSNTATVTITVTPVEDSPVAVDDIFTTLEDTSKTFAAPGVLVNDFDPEGDPISAIQVTGPASGSVTFNANGSFAYRGDPNFNGTDSFTYKVSDGKSDLNTATVTINVKPVNDPPSGNGDSYTTAEDTQLTVNAPGVLANDVDIDGDPIEPLILGAPSLGSLILNPDGSFIYTPKANRNGSDFFTYRLTDGHSLSSTIRVDLTISPVNDAPVVVNSSYIAYEDKRLTVSTPGLLAYARDIDGGARTAVKVTDPANGTISLNPNGSFVYTPSHDYNGADSFTYKVNDSTLNSNIATVSINVKPINDAPIAAPDSFDVNEDEKLVVPAPGLLANDSDVEGNPIVAVKVSNPSHGALVFSSNGSFTYKPALNWNGEDSFTYKAKDNLLPSTAVKVTITVRPSNDAPVAVQDRYKVEQDSMLAIDAPGLLTNDKDLDGDALSAARAENPAHGVINVNPDGSFLYTPAPGFYGTDQFSYLVNDSELDSIPAVVLITVDKLNLSPVAEGESYTIDEDHRLTVSAPGLLANDSDPESHRIKMILVSRPSNGRLTYRVNGWFSYKPNHNWNGEDSFTYKVSDGVKVSDEMTAAITVNPVDDVPVARSDVYVTEMNQNLEVGAQGVMENDSEFDGDPITAALLKPPLYGTIEFQNDGSFSYIPKTNFYGIDYFKYRINDGGKNSNITTVTVKVKRPVYTFSGFFDPLVNGTSVNVMTAGNSVMIPFSLDGDRGMVISPNNSPSSEKISCSSTATYVDVETTSDVAGLTYDSVEDRYTYVWETNPGWTGTCRRFILKLNDTTIHIVKFKFK